MPSEREKMLAGELYDPLDPELPLPAEPPCAGLGVAPDTSDVICLTEGSARTSKTRVTSRPIVILPLR